MKTNKEVYTLQADGTCTVHIEELDVQVPTTEEVIAEKEAQLLSIYEEIQALKNEQQS